MTPEQQRALDEYLAGLKSYGEFQTPESRPELLTSTGLEDLQYDPAMRQYEMAALQALEQQSREGYTAQDRAAMAQIEQDVSRQNRGRMGAIQQGMQRRGLAGSGMDLASQLQSAQSANEVAAMRALEQEGQATQRMQQGKLGAAQLAGNIGQRDYQSAAAKAQAQRDIAQFNATNRMQAQQYNIRQAQDAADRAMKARTGSAQMQYNAASDRERQRLMREEEDRRRKSGLASAVLGTAGAGIGAYFGGPSGAGAGYGIGSGLGQALGFADGGRVPEYNLGLNTPKITDTMPAMLTPGEIVLPVGVADSPSAAAQFVANQKQAEQNLASAQKTQDYLSYADLAAKGLSDYSKSQARNVYLPSRFEDIGRGPDVYQTPVNEFKEGSIAKLGAEGLMRAKEGMQEPQQKFATSMALDKYQREQPESPQAKAAQLLLTSAINNKIGEANRFKDPETAQSLKNFIDTGIGNLSPSEALQMQQMIKGIDYGDTLKLLTAKQPKQEDELTRLMKEGRYREMQASEEKRKTEAQQKQDELKVGDYGYAPTIDEAKKARDAIAAKKTFDNKLNAIIDLRKQYGGEALNRDAVALGKQLATQLQLEYKNLAQLGVLSASDLSMIENVIPSDPLEFNMPLSNKTMEKLLSLRDQSNAEFDAKLGAKLKAPIPEAMKYQKGAQGGSTLRETEQDL